jgi:hypothetical protein
VTVLKLKITKNNSFVAIKFAKATGIETSSVFMEVTMSLQ